MDLFSLLGPILKLQKGITGGVLGAQKGLTSGVLNAQKGITGGAGQLGQLAGGGGLDFIRLLALLGMFRQNGGNDQQGGA